MRYVYPCVLRPEEGGGYYVVFPDVPGALTSGKDREETLEMGEDALVAALGREDALVAALGRIGGCTKRSPFPVR